PPPVRRGWGVRAGPAAAPEPVVRALRLPPPPPSPPSLVVVRVADARAAAARRASAARSAAARCSFALTASKYVMALARPASSSAKNLRASACWAGVSELNHFCWFALTASKYLTALACSAGES